MNNTDRGLVTTIRVGDAAVVATADGDIRIECVREGRGRVAIRIAAPVACRITRDERPPREG